MPLAKIVLSLFLLLLSFAGVLLLVNYRRIMFNLQQMEISADQERDNVMFNFTVARSNLSQLKERFSIPLLQEAAPSINDLLSHVGSLAFLVMRRDPNLLKWGSTLLNLGKSAYGYFKGKQYNM
jgi:hypothetical protein